MFELKQLLPLAERLAEVARGLGIETALIGAGALAVHQYERATKDLDLATNVDPGVALVELERVIRDLGFHTKLNMPDDMDDLGGVLNISEEIDEDGDLVNPLQVVNFYNPHRPRRNPGAKAVARAVPLDASSPLRCVRLDDLIALKLATHAGSDEVDIVNVLARNPNADLEVIRATCAPYGFSERLETLIAESAVMRARLTR